MRARLGLFAVFAVTLPLPFFMAAPGTAPLLRIAMLALILAAVVASDGFGGTAPLFLGFLTVQLVLYGALLYGLAAAVAALGRRLLPGSLRLPAAAALVAALFGASLLPIYHTPHSSSGPRANLLHLLD